MPDTPVRRLRLCGQPGYDDTAALREYRICAEFRGFEDDHLRFYWCDGLVPERYDRHGEEWHISGSAWIGTLNAPSRHERHELRPEPWKFILFAGHARDRNEIDWQELLPGDRLTGWLTPDPDDKALKVDPAVGGGRGDGAGDRPVQGASRSQAPATARDHGRFSAIFADRLP